MGKVPSKNFSPSTIVFGSFVIYPRKSLAGPAEARARADRYQEERCRRNHQANAAPIRRCDRGAIGGYGGIDSAGADLRQLGLGLRLVPTPGHGVTDQTYLWSTKIVCDAMVSAGLGASMRPFVKRLKAVTKAATAGPGERPTPLEHYSSMAVAPSLNAPDDILVVDDILTNGCTVAGAVARLQEAFPKARIRAFAIARTDVLDKYGFVDPIVGCINVRPDGSWAERVDCTGATLF